MDTKLSLINNAQAAYEQRLNTAKHFQQIAESLEIGAVELMETISHVLAAVGEQLKGGKPLTSMSPETAAAFLAGVEFITKTLPGVKDKQGTEKVLRILNNVGMGPDGKITAGTAETIAKLAQNNPQTHQQLKAALSAYGQTPKPNQQLSDTVGKLRIAIERAMAVASQVKPAAGAQPTQQVAPQGTAAQAAPTQLNRPAPAKPAAPGGPAAPR